MGLLTWIIGLAVLGGLLWFVLRPTQPKPTGNDVSAGGLPERPLPGERTATSEEIEALNDGQPGVAPERVSTPDATSVKGPASAAAAAAVGGVDTASAGTSDAEADVARAAERNDAAIRGSEGTVRETDEHGHPRARTSSASADDAPSQPQGVVRETDEHGHPRGQTSSTAADDTSSSSRGVVRETDEHGHPRRTKSAADTSSATDADSASTTASTDTDGGVRTGDSLHDVREMMKILNLRESDAGRLEISEDDYRALHSGERGSLSPERVDQIADRLRAMIV